MKVSESNILKELVETIKERKNNPVERSYTSYLFEEGLDKILKKVGEECTEVVIGCKNGSREETVYEISDLVYHLIVLMVQQGIELEEVQAELEKRRKKTCNKKVKREEVVPIH